MAKLKNVTLEELKALDEATDVSIFWDIANRIEKGYCDNLETPAELALTFLGVSRASADLASKILLKAQMQEQKRELQALLKAKIEAEK